MINPARLAGGADGPEVEDEARAPAADKGGVAILAEPTTGLHPAAVE